MAIIIAIVIAIIIIATIAIIIIVIIIVIIIIIIIIIITGVSHRCLKKHSFYIGLCPANQQQKLQSSPRFGTLKACPPTRLLLRRSVFSQTPTCLMSSAQRHNTASNRITSHRAKSCAYHLVMSYHVTSHSYYSYYSYYSYHSYYSYYNYYTYYSYYSYDNYIL